MASHEWPPCAALYNSTFRQVVSGCHGGTVSVWDIMNGQKVQQFQAHGEQAVKLTAMAFDGTEQRLITGSEDGALRFWDFTNGTLLTELPTVQESKVTGIHHNNQRAYVSGWSKQVTQYFEPKGDNDVVYRVWKRHHAEEIHAMCAYANKMLATASRSGDVIVWNLDSGCAICQFNVGENPLPWTPVQRKHDEVKDPSKTTYQKPRNPGQRGISEEPQKARLAVEKVLFLSSRENRPDTAILLVSAANGYTYAHSVHPEGGLLGWFHQKEGSTVSSMTTDSRDHTLLTGDSHGYVALWDIRKYCYHMRSDEAAPFKCQGPGRRDVDEDVASNRRVLLKPPNLLNSWQGHLNAVVHLEVVESFQLIVTAGVDCSVRLWTIAGEYVGTFGTDRWCLYEPDTLSRRLPEGLKNGNRSRLRWHNSAL
ncbi:WD repeat-containing protein on Y chromosome-like isoform X2 [Denticeps clupeoides]|uniref:WD repeat-containing protein on Y chromosome-like isoform X2 n=1 Tax=Denticeps clupeoides TaxID=299321 RepID=UPI0010A5775D|nr:WD repeat-containing protein on Y chromosome-like isoform X2 [Denticeps clupeoides]